MSNRKRQSQVISLQEQSEKADQAVDQFDNQVKIIDLQLQLSNTKNRINEQNRILGGIKDDQTNYELHSFKQLIMDNVRIYRDLLRQCIENIIIGTPKTLQFVTLSIKKLSIANKNGINLIAVLNLGVIKKLLFISEKMKQNKDLWHKQMDIVGRQTDYWTQYLFECLLDTEQQEIRYMSTDRTRNESKKLKRNN